MFFKVEVFGEENLPVGGFLLVPNHMNYFDAAMLLLACPRPIRFIVHQTVWRTRWLQPIFKLAKAIPIPNVDGKEAAQEVVERVKMGEVVCIFTEGELSRKGV